MIVRISVYLMFDNDLEVPVFVPVCRHNEGKHKYQAILPINKSFVFATATNMSFYDQISGTHINTNERKISLPNLCHMIVGCEKLPVYF